MMLNYQFHPKFSTDFIFSVGWFVKADSAIIIIRMDNSALRGLQGKVRYVRSYSGPYDL